MQDRRNEILRHIPTLLARWQGAAAELREMTSSHRSLRIFLRSPGRNGHLLIACIDPLHINAPVFWEEANIQIAIDESDGFVVVDASAKVRIRTGGVEVKEFD